MVDRKTCNGEKYSEAKERVIILEYLRSGECLIESTEFEDFWKFHSLYRRKLEQSSGIESLAASLLELNDRESTRAEGSPPLPRNYHAAWLCPLTVQRRMRDKRDAREQKQRQAEQKQAESRVARHIIAAYLHFCQRTTFAKLKKLHDAQKNLPIYFYREEIVSAVRENPVVIVAGDTGCGKSTQLPQYLLQQGYQAIVCTQPRRLACVALCQRVAYETLQQYGDKIGYQIRFERRRTQNTRVIFVTEGLLLRQVSADPLLSDYDVVVLDEVHERHLQGDFLLGVVKCLVLRRPQLRVVLMSATINVHLFQDYFNGNAPVIQIPGRLYPIELVYRPIPVLEKTTKSSRLNPAPFVRVLSLINHKYSDEERGDLLIFLSGVKEIGIVAEACQEYAREQGRWIILPLHSSLSVSEQEKVFAVAPDGARKCIVSTNIAETSVTIDGVRFVVDSGRVKEMTYDSSTRMQRLKEFWVSQASAEQRKGRAGRTGPGVCYRLYSQAEYDLLAPYSRPEVQRVPLHSLVLQTVAMGLADVRKFPFVDRPEEEALEAAVQQLIAQGALTDEERLTPLGHMLAALPVDVSVGTMLVTGALLRQTGPTLSVAAALSVQSPWTHQAHRQPDILLKVKELMSSHGDPVTLLELFASWLQLKVTQRARSRRWCLERGVEEQRLFELVKLRRQFVTILEEAKLLPKPPRLTTSSDRIRRNGELAQLRRAKRKLAHQSASAAKRVLQVPPPGGGDSSCWSAAGGVNEEEDGAGDVGTLDLLLHSNDEELQELVRSSRMESFRDLTMLKIIICRGLYPNFAVPDRHNSYKANVDQVFHAPSRCFVILHPNSSLAFSPEVLQVCDADCLPGVAGEDQLVTRSARHSPVANTHQMLAFVTLLETTKPYVTNVLRVPTLQMMLLFCSRIDTSLNCTVICCDQWLEFVINSAGSAQQLLARAIALRRQWLHLLQLHFSESESVDTFETEEVSELRRRLTDALTEFVHTDVFYSFRRLLPADLDDIYQQQQQKRSSDTPATTAEGGSSGGQNSYDTGLTDGSGVTTQLPHYVHYNVLVSNDTIDSTECQCPYCDRPVSCLPLQRVLHWTSCSASSSALPPARSPTPNSSCPHPQSGEAASGGVSSQQEQPPSASTAPVSSHCDPVLPDSAGDVSRAASLSNSPAGAGYHCPLCNCWLSLSAIDILKHKRQHTEDRLHDVS